MKKESIHRYSRQKQLIHWCLQNKANQRRFLLQELSICPHYKKKNIYISLLHLTLTGETLRELYILRMLLTFLFYIQVRWRLIKPISPYIAWSKLEIMYTIFVLSCPSKLNELYGTVLTFVSCSSEFTRLLLLKSPIFLMFV